MKSLVAGIENNFEIVKENLVNTLDESKDKNRDIFNNENRKEKTGRSVTKNDGKNALNDRIKNNYQNENKILNNQVIDDTSYEIKNKNINDKGMLRKKNNPNSVESNTACVKDQNTTVIHSCTHVLSSNIKAEIRESKDKFDKDVEILVEGESNIDEDTKSTAPTTMHINQVPTGSSDDRLWINHGNNNTIEILNEIEKEMEIHIEGKDKINEDEEFSSSIMT